MLTTLSGKQVTKLVRLGRSMLEAPDGAALRREVGPLVLDLFRADQYASFVHGGEAAGDAAPAILNMDPENVARYRAWFQYRDPITGPMRRAGRAVHANQVLVQRDLERTEFFGDFLAVDGLCYGMNFHAFARRGGRRHLGDLRIWRNRRSGNFDAADVALLQAVGELFEAALAVRPADPHPAEPPSAAFARRHGLTPRETEVLECLAAGRRDADIACRLAISPETVRSHLKAIYLKSGCAGRAAVLATLVVDARPPRNRGCAPPQSAHD